MERRLAGPGRRHRHRAGQHDRREIIAAGLHNVPFIERATTGFEDYRRTVEPYTLERGEQLTKVPAAMIRQLAHAYARADRNLELHVQNNTIVNVTSPSDHSVTHGHLCIKGRFGFQHVQNLPPS
jgi:predicted molibdopterin-dependent oxidoreductase YjgC